MRELPREMQEIYKQNKVKELNAVLNKILSHKQDYDQKISSYEK